MTAIILINFILPLPFLDYNYNLSPFLNELSLYIVLYFKCSHILYIVYSTQFSLLAAYCSNILIKSIYLSKVYLSKRLISLLCNFQHTHIKPMTFQKSKDRVFDFLLVCTKLVSGRLPNRSSHCLHSD